MRQAGDGHRSLEQSPAEAAEEVYWPLIPVNVVYGQTAGAKSYYSHASVEPTNLVARPSHRG